MNAPVPPDRITREETIFNAAIELSDSAKRAAYLELACDGDSALRARLEKSRPKQQEMARDFMKLMKEAEIDVNRPEWQDFVRQFRQMMEARAGAGGPAGPPGAAP